MQSEVCPLFFGLGTGDELSRTFSEAGFEGVRTERLSTALRYASEEEALGAAFAGGPVAMAYSRFEPAVKDELHAEYLASIARYRSGAGYAIPGEFVIVRGDTRT